jgi:Bifunctional DNA primase/polymerase, N-terminal/Primase C terminal 2 (PriCT-2)/Family of unknown function (DUF5906)
MVDHALQYAGRSWRVFPLQGKVPFKGTRGFKDATTDSATIEAWWGRRPDANVGIATGNGLMVLDIDGAEGLAELQALVVQHGRLPRTLAVRTGNGIHLYFNGEGVRSSARGNLHVRGEGGYVVAPPSLHPSGRRYQWVDASVTVIDLPGWLKEWMVNGQGQKDNSPVTVTAAEVPGYLAQLPARGLAGRALQAIKQAESTWSPQEQRRIESALSVLRAKGYDFWIEIGMALHSLQWFRGDGTDVGLELWNDWSQTEPDSYLGIGDLEKHWRSFRIEPGGKGIGTLFHHAKEAGWDDPAAQPVLVDPEAPKASGHANVNGTGGGDHGGVNATTGTVEDGARGAAGGPDAAQETESNGHTFPFDEPLDPRTKKNPLIVLNEKYAVIGDLGGKCLVMSWIPSKVDESVKIPSFQTFRAFADRYAHKYVVVPRLDKDGNRIEKTEQLGACWLKWGKRQSYEGIDLAPEAPAILPNGYLNLWHGFAVQAAAGGWELMKRHVIDVLAAGDLNSAKYIIRFAAWAVQHPGERAEVALVFRGGKGSGKGTFANALVRIFGSHGLQIYSSKHLVGAFNGHLRSCLLLFADEAFWAGDKQGESVLKGMLTERTLVIEQKGIDATPWKNRLHVIMAANADWVVPASHDERRYAMFNVDGSRIGDRTYFAALHHELAGGGLAAMLYDLQRIDLGDWHPRQVIHTEALREQKERSLNPLHEWFEGLLQSAQLPGVPNPDGGIPASAIVGRARDENPKLREVSVQAFGKFLRGFGCEGYHSRNGNFWRFKPLKDMRKLWESKFYFWQWRNELDQWLS